MRFFGKRYAGPAYQACKHAPTPTGAPCAHCREPIGPEDDGWLIPYAGGEHVPPELELPYHWECNLRQIAGCVQHQLHFGSGPCDGSCLDDPGLTTRQAALAAALLFEAICAAPMTRQ